MKTTFTAIVTQVEGKKATGIQVPADLTATLIEHDLLTVFEGLSYSVRKEHVRQMESAKAEATRQRRISKIITTLSDG